MQTQIGEQQPDKQQERARKLSPWIVLIIVLLLLSIGLLALWVINQVGLIQKPWSNILSSVLSTIAVVVGGLFSTASAIVVAVLNKATLQELVSRLSSKQTPKDNSKESKQEKEGKQEKESELSRLC